MTRATTPAAPPPARELTFDEFLALPESGHHPTEVVNGVLVEMPAPSGGHQWVTAKLYRGLFPHVEGTGFGVVIFAPADLLIRRLPKLQVREPDVMVFSAARTGLRTFDDVRRIRIFEVVPEVVVEVLSPGQTAQTLAEKLDDYAAIGVPELWLVDPEAETVEVLALGAGRYARAGFYRQGDTIRSPALPGLALAVASIFA